MKWLLSSLFMLSSAYGAEMTLYAINSPVALNWESPRSLLLSTIRSSVNPTRQGRSNHTIGHAYLGFKCDGQEEIISGMTSGKGFSSRNNLFNEKHGLSVILQDNPGHFQVTEESKKDVEFFSRISNRMMIMQVEITEEQCQKMQSWYEEFKNRTVHIYGGVGKRPLTGEGSGCTAYAMSYMETAQVDYDLFNKLFEHTIYIPKELLGGDFGDQIVPLNAIMGNTQKMNVKAANTLEVKVYDPNTMYNWMLARWMDVKNKKNSSDLENYEASLSRLNKSSMLILKRK